MNLVAGATGYIGGRLIRRLEAEGWPVRCLCRHPEALIGRVADSTELFTGDLLNADSLSEAFSGVNVAFYLVHAMLDGSGFEAAEKEAAGNFAQAAREAGVRRILYLGALAQGEELSPHMRSRVETGKILRSSRVPVIELRASIVIGSGSASFEVIRALVERLPVMITPRWVNTAAQPIAIEDVIDYLVAAARLPGDTNRIFEIGGRDVTSYVGIMREFARQRRVRRWMIRVPLLTPWLSSRWLTFITPVYASIGRSLIESVRNASVVQDPEALRVFEIRPMGIASAIERALANEDQTCAATRWSDARAPRAGQAIANTARGKLLTYERSLRVAAPPSQAFAPIRRIGGQTGWYFGNTLWRIRGLMDLMMGGVGLRRGRPDPETPLLRSVLDFWRVDRYEPDRRLRLLAEMKVPGRAWLDFCVEPDGAAGSRIKLAAQFEPDGWSGRAYWYVLYPVHEVMFRGMLRRISMAALRAKECTVEEINFGDAKRLER